MQRASSILLLSLLGLFIAPSAADACSCVGGTPLCQSFWTTDAVFSGEVISIASTPNPSGEQYLAHRLVRLKVVDAFRGGVQGVVEVATGAGGGDCGYNFIQGMTYLVYAHVGKSGLSTSICSRTRVLSQAGEDLAYIRGTLQQPSAAGRIFGRVMYSRDPDGPPGTESTPITGYTVTLSDGRTTRSTTTGRDGTYEFTGVAAGSYTVQVQHPDTEDAGGPNKVRLADPRGCAAANFYVVPDGRIRVRLVGADGRPAAKLRVDLLNLDAESDERPAWQSVFSETDSEGVLELEQLRPRRYLLAINGQSPPTSKSPFPTSYYPGVPTRDGATVITLGRGERLDLGKWVLPSTLREHRVTGLVVLGDGRPATRAHIIVETPKDAGWQYWFNGGDSATTDAEGRFELTLLEGVPYEIFAYAEFGEDRIQVRSPRVLFKATSTKPLKLVIPR
jgi:hypothetical protein